MPRINKDMRLWGEITRLIESQGTLVGSGVFQFNEARFMSWERVVQTPEFTVGPQWQQLHFTKGSRAQFMKFYNNHVLAIANKDSE